MFYSAGEAGQGCFVEISYCIEISIFDEAQLCAELERTILALGYFCSVAETYFVNAG